MLVLTLLLLGILSIPGLFLNKKIEEKQEAVSKAGWVAPDTSQIPVNPEGDLIRYGRNLVKYTGYYLGPKGSVMAISNGMNCQNCHLEAGTKLYGNNYSAVYPTYPKYRHRSGTIENIYKRINDCFERSLNAQKLDTTGREMRAIASYINWVGKDLPKEKKPPASGITEIKLLTRAADAKNGAAIYQAKCIICHGPEGKGQLDADGIAYIYPPLWGDNSYTVAAGLFRLSNLAGFIRDNMPFGASHNLPQLSDEEAWDLAAFINSQPRPEKRFSNDWPVLAGKPFDLPFPPYADSFPVDQHKYGPFGPIKEWIAKHPAPQKK